MNLLECIARVGVDEKNVIEMLDITVIRDNPRIELLFNELVDDFKEELLALFCNHTPEEYIIDIGQGITVDVTDIISDEYFYLDDETEEIDEAERDEFNSRLTQLAETEVSFIQFQDNEVIYCV